MAAALPDPGVEAGRALRRRGGPPASGRGAHGGRAASCSGPLASRGGCAQRPPPRLPPLTPAPPLGHSSPTSSFPLLPDPSGGGGEGCGREHRRGAGPYPPASGPASLAGRGPPPRPPPLLGAAPPLSSSPPPLSARRPGTWSSPAAPPPGDPWRAGEPYYSPPSAARADAALQGAAAGCARGGWPRPTWSIAHVHKLLWELRTKGPAVQ